MLVRLVQVVVCHLNPSAVSPFCHYLWKLHSIDDPSVKSWAISQCMQGVVGAIPFTSTACVLATGTLAPLQNCHHQFRTKASYR